MAERYDENLFLGYVEGDLTPAEHARFATHLAKDANLRHLVEQVAGDRRLLRDLPDEEAPEELIEAVRQRLERRMLLDGTPLPFPGRDARSADLGRRRYHFARWASYGGIAALLVLSGGLLYQTLRHRDPLVHPGNPPDAENLALAPHQGQGQAGMSDAAGSPRGTLAKGPEEAAAFDIALASRMEVGYDGQFACVIPLPSRDAAADSLGRPRSAPPAVVFGDDIRNPRYQLALTKDKQTERKADVRLASAGGNLVMEGLPQVRLEVAADSVRLSRRQVLDWAGQNGVALLADSGMTLVQRSELEMGAGPAAEEGVKVGLPPRTSAGAVAAGNPNPTEQPPREGAAGEDHLALVIPAGKVASLVTFLNASTDQRADLVSAESFVLALGNAADKIKHAIVTGVSTPSVPAPGSGSPELNAPGVAPGFNAPGTNSSAMGAPDGQAVGGEARGPWRQAGGDVPPAGVPRALTDQTPTAADQAVASPAATPNLPSAPATMPPVPAPALVPTPRPAPEPVEAARGLSPADVAGQPKSPPSPPLHVSPAAPPPSPKAAATTSPSAATQAIPSPSHAEVEGDACKERVYHSNSLHRTDWGALLNTEIPLEPTAPVLEADTQVVLPVVIYDRAQLDARDRLGQ